GLLYGGDAPPRASDPSEIRGPRGYDELNQARQAGNFGWPFFIADNQAYQDWDFATATGKGWFDPAAPVNDSPNNTGIRTLPPAQPAFLFYPYAKTEDHPLLGDGGRSAMAGPVFRASRFEGDRFPDYFEGRLFMHEWMRNKVLVITMDAEGNYRYMEEFLPEHPWSRPMDMAFASDGSLYVLEYGRAWNTRNEDAKLTRIRYTK
ncbi:MAG: cytochrome C, partial [Bacteroidetes bacterium]|nr:cytochrome C [Bacteroidota bacterium]